MDWRRCHGQRCRRFGGLSWTKGTDSGVQHHAGQARPRDAVDYGADFYQVGKQTGNLGAQILRGADPSQIPITNMVPTWFVINKLALKGLNGRWHVPDDLLQRADVVVDQEGIHMNKSPSKQKAAKS